MFSVFFLEGTKRGQLKRVLSIYLEGHGVERWNRSSQLVKYSNSRCQVEIVNEDRLLIGLPIGYVVCLCRRGLHKARREEGETKLSKVSFLRLWGFYCLLDIPRYVVGTETK